SSARPPAADDEHPCLSVLHVVAATVARVLVELAEPGHVAQELLVQRPELSRADHRPVVEADRGERAADLVDDAHEVEVELPDDVLRLHDGALAQGLDADADIRHAVDGHQAIRAVTRAAEKPARAVVLEGAGEDAPSAREEGRRDRVALVPAHLPRPEPERKLLRPVDSLARLRLEPHVTSAAIGSAPARA